MRDTLRLPRINYCNTVPELLNESSTRTMNWSYPIFETVVTDTRGVGFLENPVPEIYMSIINLTIIFYFT